MTVKQEGKKEDTGDVELPGVSGGGEAPTAAAVAQAELVPTGHTLLDPQTIAVLSRMDSFFIQQRIRMIEAVTGGCIEQANVYDVFDHATNKRIMIMKEESDGCSRCCCSPDHSVFVKFYHVAASAPELQPGQLVDWSYDPSEEAGGSPFMTFEREGCDCCCKGLCPKPCLCCFACKESCSQVGTLHAGDVCFLYIRIRTNMIHVSVCVCVCVCVGDEMCVSIVRFFVVCVFCTHNSSIDYIYSCSFLISFSMFHYE